MLFRRSLLQELITTAAGAFLILLGIVIAQRAGYLIQIAANGVLPNDAITTMLGFNLIRFLPMLLSLSLFLSVLMTLSRWYRDSEMIIWFSSSLSINSLIRPLLIFATPIIILISILSLFITPWATNKVEDYLTQLKSRDDLATISPGVFKESADAERVFFVESFDELGNVVKNIFVQSIQHQKLGIIISAQGNRLAEKNGDNFLEMHNGRRYQGVRGTAEFSTTEFEKYALRVEVAKAQRDPPSTESKSSRELIQNRNSTNNAELQRRLAIPVSALVLVLLAIPLSSLDPRSVRSANFAVALVIYVIYNNALSIIQTWIAQEKISGSIGLWPIHAMFLTLAIYMFHRRVSQRPIFPRIFPASWSKMLSKQLIAKQ